MVAAGFVVAISGCLIVALAIYGLLAVAFNSGQDEPKVIGRYTQSGWRGRSKNWKG